MRYVMKGGNPLAGEVTISGAKNAALGILAAAIMSDETVIIENLPDVRDVAVMLEAFREIGVLVDRSERHRVKINAANIFTACADNPLLRKSGRAITSWGPFWASTVMRRCPCPGAAISATGPSTST